MIGAEAHKKCSIGGILERIANHLDGILPLHIGFDVLEILVVESFPTFVFNGSRAHGSGYTSPRLPPVRASRSCPG